jgi:hypothetical protein
MHLRGVPLSVVAAWLGHADASVTARIYAHSQPDALKAASVTLGAVDKHRATHGNGVGNEMGSDTPTVVVRAYSAERARRDSNPQPSDT